MKDSSGLGWMLGRGKKSLSPAGPGTMISLVYRPYTIDYTDCGV